MEGLTILAPAKINLCLSVLGRRPDGYHELEMLMQAVGLYDEVRVERSRAGIAVKCDSSAVPEGEENIAWRAAREMVGLARAEGVSISIKKWIPVAAGLAGGSSDAAAVIYACNVIFGLGLSTERLAEIGERIGMDVPFFFYGPTALARGRGEVLESVPPPGSYWVLLVNPGFGISTAWVYKNLNLRLTKRVDCNKISRLAVGELSRALHNDLETVTAAAYPEIGRMKKALMAAGALGARMSGSGPTVFGIFDTENSCKAAAETLSNKGWQLYPVPALTEPPFRSAAD